MNFLPFTQPNKMSHFNRYLSTIGLVFAIMLYQQNIMAQHLKISDEKYKIFAEKMLMQYDDQWIHATSIREYDVEKIKQLAFKNYSLLTASDIQLLQGLINQYDHQKLDLGTATDSLIKVDDHFYSAADPQSAINLYYEERKPILKYFYKSPYHFLSLNAENFIVRANPIVQLAYGNASQYSNTIFQNTRGVELSGYIDKKIYFYTKILENQASFLPFIDQYIKDFNAIPQNGYYKNYQSGIIDNISGYDFLNAQAYIGIPISKSIALEFGHGRNTIGNGIRSLLLSDFSNNYLYLKFNTNVWKLHYQNIFAEINTTSANNQNGDFLLPKKYMANHYLSIRPFKHFEIGIFESVIFARENQFELQYLNPIIFYRLAEQYVGSPDNVLIGINANYTYNHRFMLYGQLLLDEFNLGLFKKDGWYGNKQGLQLGMKYIDAFNIDQLTAQLEWNMVRPYTYSHNKPLESPISTTSYSHYGMPLAHPLGANFRESILTLQYLPASRWNTSLTMSYMEIGRNIDSLNYGNNILLNGNTYVKEYGNQLLQGQANTITFIRLQCAYEFRKNYKIFIHPQYRKSVSKEAIYNTSSLFIGGGITINLDMDKNIF